MYTNKKDQKNLETVYSDIQSKKTVVNEGISGIYPEEANNAASAIAHLLAFVVPFVLYKMNLSLKEGKLKTVKDKISAIVSNDKSNETLKNKIIRATNIVMNKISPNKLSLDSDLNQFIPNKLETKTSEQISDEIKNRNLNVKNPRVFGFRG